MAAALPYLAAVAYGIDIIQSLQGPPKPPPPPPAPPTLSWEEAMKRATEVLSPIYAEQLEKTLENLDKELIARGFYGQLPGDALKGARATDVERAKAAAIASLGAQMQGQSEENALRQQQLAVEWALNNTRLWQEQQRNRLSGLLEGGKSLFDLWTGIGLTTGFVPTFKGPQPVPWVKEGLAELWKRNQELTNSFNFGGGQDIVSGSKLSGYLPTPQLWINPY